MSLPVAPPGSLIPNHSFIEVAGDMLCSFCFQPKQISRPLKACSACRRVSYCSVDCQKKDWKDRHKFFCPQFQKVNDFDKNLGDNGCSLVDLLIHQGQRKTILQTEDDWQHEPCRGCSEQIINHEVVCEVCYKTPYQLPTYRVFDHCICGIARYCSDACKAKLSSVHSSEDCATLHLLAATERVQIDFHIAHRKPYYLERMTVSSARPRRRYVPISQYTDWDHYHRELSQEVWRSPHIIDMYRALVPTIPTSHPMAAQALGQMITEAQSIPLTIIAGLEASVRDMTSRTSLEIHIVGTASGELATKAMMEEVLHHFSRLRNLRICYVGPEIGFDDESPVNMACTTCKSLGSMRAWSVHKMEYHDFLLINRNRKPDFVVGLNTRWSEGLGISSWLSTMSSIVDLAVPALFTAYSLIEAEREEVVLRGLNAHFVVSVQKNKWRGVIPTVNRTIRFFHGNLGAYHSDFLYLFCGRQ